MKIADKPSRILLSGTFGEASNERLVINDVGDRYWYRGDKLHRIEPLTGKPVDFEDGKPIATAGTTERPNIIDRAIERVMDSPWPGSF